MPNIKLVALDLDGTVLRRDRTISERVLRSTRAATEHGLYVTVCTGRGAASVRRVADALGVNAPVICHHGSLIVDLVTGRVVHDVTLPNDVACAAVAFAQGFPSWHPIIFRGDEMLVTEQRFPTDSYSLSDIVPTVVPDPCHLLDRHGANKVMLMLDPAEAPEALRLTSAHLGEAAVVVQSSSRLVEVHAREAGKGAALARLAGHLGVPRENVMAIGDHDNDESMLIWAGWGVAMGNGSVRAKAAARWVAPAIEDDGVAVAIDRLALGRDGTV
jgi:Cof subfamily protein (haloacid dehalogenase superfamily)